MCVMGSTVRSDCGSGSIRQSRCEAVESPDAHFVTGVCPDTSGEKSGAEQ